MRVHAIWLAGFGLCLASAPLFAQSNSPERGIVVAPSEPIAPEAPVEQAPPAIERPVPQMPSSVDSASVLKEYRGAPVERVFVRHIEITGNTVLDAKEIAGITAPYEGHEIGFEQIEAVRRQLTLLYVRHGYVSSGVLLADQPLDGDGVLHLLAVEGKLDSIALSGNRHLSDSYIDKRIRGRLRPVLNVQDVEESLRLMQSWPTVAQVKAEVLPGPQRGTSILDLQVREVKPILLTIGANNHRSPSVGETQGAFSLAHRSLTRHGDYLIANYGLTDGLNDLYAAYGVPLTSRDLTLEVHYGKGNSDIVEAPFDILDIVSRTETAGVRLYRPLSKSLTQIVGLSLEFENKRSRSTLLGLPFSFSPGERDGRSEVSAVRLGVDWSRRWGRSAVGVRGKISHGVGWLDSTDNSDIPGDLPDSTFDSFLLQGEYAHQLGWRSSQLLGRLTAQLARDPLLPVEKLALGGAGTVRGYRENQLVRDQGAIASLELRLPLFVDEAGVNKSGLTFAPFVDYGIGRDRLRTLPSRHSQSLMSAGAGIIWNGWKPLYAEVYYGRQLKDRDNSGGSLQENGVQFLVTLQRRF